jgi:hypothetical protein
MQARITGNQPIGVRGGADDNWLTPGRFALLLGVLVFLAFPQVLLGWETFVIRDYGIFSYPLAYYQRQCFWHGELPHWNPYNHCGLPFLAQWNTMCLYPPALIYLLLPLSWSLGFFCLLHLWFAGVGMYFLARRWTGNCLAAALAGLVFAFNGMTLNLLMWPSHIATLSWMPWVVWTVERAWRTGRSALLPAIVAGALQMLAGGPETIALTWLLALGLLASDWIARRGRLYPILPKQYAPPSSSSSFSSSSSSIREAGDFQCGGEGDPLQRDAPSGLRMAFRFGIVVLLVTALAAAQLLPFLDLAAHSQRREGFDVARWPLPLRGWANFLVPMVFGQTSKEGVFFQHDQYWTSSYYLGIGSVLLAFWAMWQARDRRVWLLIIAAVIAYVLALGDQTFVFTWVRRLVPQLKLITYPVKFVLVITFAVPLLAAFALAQLRDGRARLSQRAVISNSQGPRGALGQPPAASGVAKRVLVLGAVLLGLLALILFWQPNFPNDGDDVPAALRNGLSRALLLLAFLAVFWLLSRSAELQRRPDAGGGKAHEGEGTSDESLPPRPSPLAPRPWLSGRPWIWSSLLLLLTWLDLWTHEPNQNPTVGRGVYQPGLARTALALKPEPRLGEARAMVSPAADEGFATIHTPSVRDGYLASRLGYSDDCNLLDEVPTVSGFFSLQPWECGRVVSVLYHATNASFPRLEDFLSVAHITAPGEFTEWQARTNFLPMVTAGQHPVFLDATNTARQLVQPDFDGARTVFLPPEAQAFISVSNETSARVVSQRFERERVAVEIAAAMPSMLVLSQAYYHWWRAEVDGEPARLWRANFAFQAVQVPAGTHRVRLAYVDRAFQVGALVSILTALGLAVTWLRMKRGENQGFG